MMILNNNIVNLNLEWHYFLNNLYTEHKSTKTIYYNYDYLLNQLKQEKQVCVNYLNILKYP